MNSHIYCCCGTCYRLVHCDTAAVLYSKDDMSANIGDVAVVDGECYTIEELGEDTCGDLVSVGEIYVDCEACEAANEGDPCVACEGAPAKSASVSGLTGAACWPGAPPASPFTASPTGYSEGGAFGVIGWCRWEWFANFPGLGVGITVYVYYVESGAGNLNGILGTTLAVTAGDWAVEIADGVQAYFDYFEITTGFGCTGGGTLSGTHAFGAPVAGNGPPPCPSFPTLTVLP